jgi:hypothetical protein
VPGRGQGDDVPDLPPLAAGRHTGLGRLAGIGLSEIERLRQRVLEGAAGPRFCSRSFTRSRA